MFDCMDYFIFSHGKQKNKQTKLLIVQLQKLNKHLEEKQAQTPKADNIPTANKAFK